MAEEKNPTSPKATKGDGGKEEKNEAGGNLPASKAGKQDGTALSKKAQDILKSVEEMPVLELNELVKALEEKFGVSAATVAAPVVAAPAEAGATPGGEEKSEYDVILAAAGENKIAAIKAIREIKPDLGLKETKELVEAAPKPVLEGAKKEEAEEAKKKLEGAGCKVELK